MYKLLKKTLGSKNISMFSEIDMGFEINCICNIKDFGFLIPIAKKNSIIHINYDGKINYDYIIEKDNQKDNLNKPECVIYNNFTKLCCIIENNGKMIKKLEPKTKIISDIYGDKIKIAMEKFFKNNRRESCIYGDITNKNHIIWTIKSLHRAYIYNLNCFKIFIGEKIKGEYANGNTTEACGLKYPSGVAFYNNSIYIADGGNYCIREFQKNIKNTLCKTIVGNPLQPGDSDGIGMKCQLLSPRCLKIKNNLAFFIDNNKIKYFSMYNNEVNTIYESPYIKSIECDEKFLYILEEENEK